MSGPTIAEILTWPATVDPATAGTAYGISRSYAYELCKRGDFPAKTLQVGGKVRVLTADILRTLGVSHQQGEAAPKSADVVPLQRIGGDRAS